MMIMVDKIDILEIRSTHLELISRSSSSAFTVNWDFALRAVNTIMRKGFIGHCVLCLHQNPQWSYRQRGGLN